MDSSLEFEAAVTEAEAKHEAWLATAGHYVKNVVKGGLTRSLCQALARATAAGPAAGSVGGRTRPEAQTRRGPQNLAQQMAHPEVNH